MKLRKRVWMTVFILITFSCLGYANPIDEYSDTLVSDGLSCWAQSNGRIVNTTPCTAGSPTAKASHTIMASQGKLALAFTKNVGLKVQAIKTRNVLTKISSFSKYVDQKIVLDSPVSGANVATAITKSPVGKCEYGLGSLSTEVDVQYKNGSSFQSTICYDKTDGALNFNHTIPEYISLPTYTTEEYYEDITPLVNGNYERMPVYDLGVQKAKVTINWHDTPVFGEKQKNKFWVIGYDTDLDVDLNDGLATVLDPYFNSSWATRMTLNLTCPSSAVGDQRCFFNDSQIIQFDHKNLVDGGLSLASGFDIRLVFRNDSPTDNDQNEIPYFNLSGFNQPNTTLMFKLQGGTNPLTDVVLTPGVVNTSYYLYFNNAGATSQNYDISQVFNRGGMDYNQTNLMMCFDFDNETTEATVFADQAKVWNRCKSGILGTSPVTEIVLNSTAAIDFEPNVDSIGSFQNITGLAARGKSVSFNVASPRCLLTQDSDQYNFKNFTLAAWFKENATSGTSTGSIISFGAPAIVMKLTANSGVFSCYLADGAVEIIADTSNQVIRNEWTFGACVYHNNGTMTVYLSNSTSGLKKTFSVDSAADTINDFTEGLSIGNRVPCTGTTNVFNGAIDNIFIYNASLEANEIAALYNWTRPREGGVVTFNYGAQETGVVNTAPVLTLNTSIWPNGTSIHLNETVDVRINVSYIDADGDNGTINGTFFVNNTQALFVSIGTVRPNTTVTFNLSNSTFGRNATIYFNASGEDNQSLDATTINSANVTVANIPPPQITNLTPTASQRVRQNFTINWNQTGDADDPMSNLGWNTTVNGTAFCGRKNATTSCLVLTRPAGQNSFNITTLDGENYTSNVQTEVFVDESAPFFINLSNYSVQNTVVQINWTSSEPTNFSINYSSDCANLNQRVTGSTFNGSGSIAISELASGTQYCWYLTLNDNVTSEFGANNNQSPTFSFITSGSPPSGQPSLGGGGGGAGGPPTSLSLEPTLDQPVNITAIMTGTGPVTAGAGSGGGLIVAKVQGSNKIPCNIEFMPKTIEVEDGRKFASILITNNEETSYSPDIGIVNVTGLTSALPRLVISNPLGEVLPHRQGQVGLIIDQGVEGGEPIKAQNQLLLIDDRCQSVLVTIETDVTGKIPLLSTAFPFFDSIINALSSIPAKIVDFISFIGDELGKPIIGMVPSLRVYMLALVIFFLSAGVMFSLDISKIMFIDTGLKITGVIIGSPIVTAIIVATIRSVGG